VGQLKKEFEGCDLLLHSLAREVVLELQVIDQPVAPSIDRFDVVLRQIEPMPTNAMLQLRPATADLVPLARCSWRRTRVTPEVVVIRLDVAPTGDCRIDSLEHRDQYLCFGLTIAAGVLCQEPPAANGFHHC